MNGTKKLQFEGKVKMKNFNEWMSFRQNVDTNDADYQFIGTYDIDAIPDLKENSDPIELEHAFELIPEQWRTKFPNVGTVVAGKTMNEDQKEIIWISIPEQSTAYLFEKN